MFVRKKILDELFRGFHIQRWNDRIRPMDFSEMDKHAHKMIIAYCLGKYEEAEGRRVDWDKIIKGGIFELLRRIVISDIKSPIFRQIKKHSEVFRKLNEYVYRELQDKIESDEILGELESHLLSEKPELTMEDNILEAAHIYASYWEFQLIRHANPNSYQNIRIETELLNDINGFKQLSGVKKLTARHTIANFVDLCGQLRFQLRWAQTPRVPKTSVLGHSMLVASISYLLTRCMPACGKRLYNNFFGGLFHDLPEAVTRDIISPVKKSSDEFDELIKNLEMELAEKEIFPHVEPEWIDEMKYFTHKEFNNKIIKDGQPVIDGLATDDLTGSYNSDSFSPYDGMLIRAADHLSAFLEAWHSCSSGIKSEDLVISSEKIRDNYRARNIGEIDFNQIYVEYRVIT
jgi:putative hydrolase of HD superfamily